MFLPGFFKNSTSDKSPNGPLSPQWFSNFIGSKSNAGALVNPDTAMQLTTLRACVTLLAESVAQLDCRVYRKEDEYRTDATDHPLYDLLMVQPNAKDSAYEYFEFSQGHLGIGGDSFSLMRRDNRSFVREIIPIHPEKVQVRKGSDGLPYYYLTEHNEVLSSRHVHHVKCFSENGYTGLSPIESNPDALGLALSVEDHASGVFSRGTTMSGVIEGPENKKLFDSQKKLDDFLNKFSERHAGGPNQFSVALLQEGMSYKQLSMDNERAQLLESRRMSVEEICRLYRVPRHMVQDDSKTNFNTVEQLSINYVIYTMLPWLKRHESAMMRDFLLPEERKDLYIQFDVSQLLRGDQKSRYESYALGRQWGWLSANDIRRLENLPPINGGNRYLTPLNMADTNSTAQPLQQENQNISSKQIEEVEQICDR